MLLILCLNSHVYMTVVPAMELDSQKVPTAGW